MQCVNIIVCADSMHVHILMWLKWNEKIQDTLLHVEAHEIARTQQCIQIQKVGAQNVFSNQYQCITIYACFNMTMLAKLCEQSSPYCMV